MDLSKRLPVDDDAKGELSRLINSYQNVLHDASKTLDDTSNALHNASDQKLEAVHNAANALSANLRKTVNKGDTSLKKVAEKFDELVMLATTSKSTYFYDATNILATAVKDSIGAGAECVQDTLKEVSISLHSALNVVDLVIKVPRGESGIPEVAEASSCAAVNTVQMVESVSNLPFRAAAKVVTTALQSFVSGDKKSPLFIIARAAVAAIEAAIDTDTPLRAATEAFRYSIENDDCAPDDSMMSMLDSMNEMVDSMMVDLNSTKLGR